MTGLEENFFATCQSCLKKTTLACQRETQVLHNQEDNVTRTEESQNITHDHTSARCWLLKVILKPAWVLVN